MKKQYFFLILLFASLFACRQPDKEPDSKTVDASYYTEPHRPQYHFSPEKKWMNDPNGMVFYEGEYHLFYQYYPDSTVWGPMHWGHAVSKDLLHWEHLPVALYPDSLGYIFSGSAVVDWNNTSGFGENEKPPMVAIFTHHNMDGEKAGRTDYQHQSIAYSNDKGRTWTKYEGNPVIPNTNKIKDFRDPKVLWDETSKQWVMAFAAFDHIKFWASKDLKNWTHLSDFGLEWGAHGGVWECPDLFPIKEENSENTFWVLLVSLNPGSPNGGSGTQYFIGNFDGKNFTLDAEFAKSVQNKNAVWLDWGRDNYAGVTWSDIPKEDGRRIFLGWMGNWNYAQIVPTETWRSAMTIPRVLKLGRTHGGLHLYSHPVSEMENLRQVTYTLDEQTLAGELDLSGDLGFSPATMEVLLEVELPAGSKTDFGIALRNSKGEEYRVGFDAVKNEFYSDRTKSGDTGFSPDFAAKKNTAPRLERGAVVRLHVFFDVASAEMFGDWGATNMTEIFFPNEDFNKVSLYATGGEAKIKTAGFYQLRSVWR